MAHYFTAFFRENGTPKTGLSPKIDVYDLADNSKLVDAGPMTEVGGGFYKYLYTPYDSDESYAAIADGTATLKNPTERYVPCNFYQ